MSAQNSSTKKLTTVGQLRLKRTCFTDPKIVRVYMDEPMLLALTMNATYENVTPDEYIRNLIKKDLGNQISA